MADPDRRDVRATYERIAEHFATTREYAWPEVVEFCEGRRARTALDVGCGNGRHAELLTEHADRVVGVDASRGLLSVARERVPDAHLLQGDAAELPLTDGSVDLAVYVATLHHLPTRGLRRQSLDELARVLAPGGTALVSAWSTAHDRFDASADDSEGFDADVDWTLPGGETVPRFYHVYAPAEFDADLAASALTVVDKRVSSGNCYAVVEPV
ncbi:class I SAM-dependent methyltransferase [Natronomonas salina]|uniref:class I SAM-dependent methyltransferase n=1 Tax=Natronomonas salina TaxID=1710540 RepID=UPI0015B52B77|nr:class I SAM-dependent methyltransferase [Natronomonas salina]QLD87540.1 class I SAM-dependent methyltransferase [Natronomonas salina]